MSVQDHIDKMKNIQTLLENYIQSQDRIEEYYQNFINKIGDLKICQNKDKLESILLLIDKVSSNHFRHKNFFNKIGHIFDFLLQRNKKFSSQELFDIFKDNKRILLLLIEQNIIVLDQSLAIEILNYPNQYANYPQYFYTEIKPFIDEKISLQIYNNIPIIKDFNFITKFKTYQRNGENHNDICMLIRNDNINQFRYYFQNQNMTYSSNIPPSIFETNIFLEKRTPTLIEYASFFGASNIFQFLFFNLIRISRQSVESCWIYMCHCPNQAILKILDDNKINPPPPDFNSIIKNPKPFNYDKIDRYNIVLEESIKCHHGDLINHILAIYINKKFKENNINNNFDKNIYAFAFHYWNFHYFPFDLNYKYIFYYACKYNHLTLVELLLKNKGINVNIPIVFHSIFLITFNNFFFSFSSNICFI